MFKVNVTDPTHTECLDLIPRIDSVLCMLDSSSFSTAVFNSSGESYRSSDFIMHFDYDTFREYGNFGRNYGRYACIGDGPLESYAKKCAECELMSGNGDYRISEQQFHRWVRMMVPHVSPHQGYYKFMFTRLNAMIPAYSLQRAIYMTEQTGRCNIDPNHTDCCGVRIVLDELPRQHDDPKLCPTPRAP